MSFKPVVVCDKQRRTAIAVTRTADAVQFIPLSYDRGFELESLPVKEFGVLFDELPDYPVERAAALYVQYSHTIGASQEALEHLGLIIKLSPKDIEMATAKKTAAATSAAAKKTAKTAVPAKKAAKGAAPAKEAKTPKTPKEAGPKKPSAASRFKELIMAGELTDDKIFAKVQKEFGLDDSKRSYVAWYRNDLTKKGEKPPAAKE